MNFLKNSSFNVLYTKNLELTEKFYKTIGAEIQKVESDKVVVGIGDFDLHFILAQSEPFEEYHFVANSNEYGSGNIFYIEVENLENLFELVENAGGKIKSQIKENHWDCKEFLFEDVNGYKFAAYK